MALWHWGTGAEKKPVFWSEMNQALLLYHYLITINHEECTKVLALSNKVSKNQDGANSELMSLDI